MCPDRSLFSLGRKVGLANRNGVDVPDGAPRFLDGAQGHHQRVHELLEVIIRNVDTQMHEVMLPDERFRLVAGSYKTIVV